MQPQGPKCVVYSAHQSEDLHLLERLWPYLSRFRIQRRKPGSKRDVKGGGGSEQHVNKLPMEKIHGIVATEGSADKQRLNDSRCPLDLPPKKKINLCGRFLLSHSVNIRARPNL